MKRTFISFIILLIAHLAFSQVPQDPKEIFLDAEYFILYEEYLDALPGYLQLYETDPENANLNYRIGICYLNIPGEKSKAVVFLEVAVKNITPSYREGSFTEDRAPIDAYFYLGNAYLIQNEYSQASRTYTKYLEFVDPADTVNINYVNQQIKACKTAQVLIKSPVFFEKRILGENINDENSNFNPLVSGDQTSIVYMTSEKFYDAIYYAKKEGDNWGARENLTPYVQSDGDLYTSALSFSGTELFLSKDDDFNSDLYSSKLVDGVWTTAEKLNKNINTRYWESHAGISPNGNTLYFTSNRKGGIGGLDIWKSEREEATGDWGPAVNLGPEINTPYNEDTPFMTDDGSTLYFSSQGHENMGGFDIFYSTLGDDGTWSEPVNLGYPLNTSDDDLFFVPVNNGINAYYTIFDPLEGSGKEDIYLLDIFSDRNPREVEVKGTVSLADSPKDYEKPIQVNVIDRSNNKPLTTISSDPQTGRFSYKTRTPGEYQLVFTGEGYQKDEKDFTVPADYSLAEIVIMAELEPVAKAYIILRSIFFDFDKYSIKASEKPKLEALAEIMKEQPDLKVEIIGNTDAKGPDGYNQRLSINRANSTIQFLTGKGISMNRFKMTGAGENDPIAINNYIDGSDCPPGRELNRRVDIHVTETENELIVPEEIIVPEELKTKKK